MRQRKFKRSADDADEEADVFAANKSESDEENEVIDSEEDKVVQKASSKKNNNNLYNIKPTIYVVQNKSTNRQLISQDTPLKKRTEYSSKDKKRTDDVYTVFEPAPYFQHERRKPEPESLKKEQRNFVFHADEEETPKTKPSKESKMNANSNQDRWHHDGFELLETKQKLITAKPPRRRRYDYGRANRGRRFKVEQ